MEPEKSPAGIYIPATLFAEAQQVAVANHISVDELVRDAVERRLGERKAQHLHAPIEGNLVVKENDVERIAHEFQESHGSLSLEEWDRRFEEWTSRPMNTSPPLLSDEDISRESIYSERGL